MLFVTPWYPTKEEPSSGIFVREHARAAAISSDVSVLHLAGSADALGCEEVTDPEVTAGIPTWRVWHGALPVPRTDVFAQTWALNRAITWLRKERGIIPQIIHAHVFLAGFPSVVVGRLKRLPVVVSEHYSAFPLRTLAWHDLLKARITFKLADRVLPVSSMLKDSIEACGIQASFQVVPNVVDTDLFFPSESLKSSTPTILYVGHLYEEKGIGDLLAALGEPTLLSQDWQLVVIGAGSQDRWRAAASKMGIAARVEFVGPIPKMEVGEWMRNSAALVIPSWLETQSVVLLEAMASGLPVIATEVDAITEGLLEGGGVQFPARDRAALAGRLVEFLDGNHRLGNPFLAHSVRERYGLEQVGQTLDLIYEEICNRVA